MTRLRDIHGPGHSQADYLRALAAGYETGWWDERGIPAPWPDDPTSTPTAAGAATAAAIPTTNSPTCSRTETNHPSDQQTEGSPLHHLRGLDPATQATAAVPGSSPMPSSSLHRMAPDVTNPCGYRSLKCHRPHASWCGSSSVVCAVALSPRWSPGGGPMRRRELARLLPRAAEAR